MSEPRVVVHDSPSEIVAAHEAEYRVKGGHGILGFYGVKSNTIHLLSEKVVQKCLWEHEYAHYQQRNTWKMRYVVAVCPYQDSFVYWGIIIAIVGASISILLLSSPFLLVASVFTGIGVAGLSALADYFNLKMEKEAMETTSWGKSTK